MCIIGLVQYCLIGASCRIEQTLAAVNRKSRKCICYIMCVPRGKVLFDNDFPSLR